MRTLNLGIVAHVDAGKTSLTERLLFAAGAIDELGSVDGGSTRTDSLALERTRGITIRSAVASFRLGEVTVNLIDTPGHPDFIAEVERVLDILDGAVLVVSAVEGVQAQTRVLMGALRRLGVPTLVFVNKIDRHGARPDAVLRAVAAKLTPSLVPMGTVRAAGTRAAEFVPLSDDGVVSVGLEQLADHDEALLAAWVTGGHGVSPGRVHTALADQTGRCVVHPVFFGSAITGAGIESLSAGLTELLPDAGCDVDAPVSGTVFAIGRGRAGEKLVHARLFAGTVRVRDRLALGPAAGAGREAGVGREASVGQVSTVTGVQVFDGGPPAASPAVRAGQIAVLHGLADARVGDTVGVAPVPRSGGGHRFAAPTLEAVVVPRYPADRVALHTALARLAEQDPLIGYRLDEARHEIRLSLYGEVQKEVVASTLADEFGVEVAFRGTVTICVERPVGTGAALETLGQDGNPFLATVGLRVDPAPVGAGTTFQLEVQPGAMPQAFFTAVRETVTATLAEGPHGWQVLDCAVTLTHTGYWARQSHAHATFDKAMSSTAGDFRLLTPLVLMAALSEGGGTRVLEPVHRFQLTVPGDSLSAVLSALARLRGVPLGSTAAGPEYVVDGDIPAAAVHELTRQLPGLTRGEGVLQTAFDHHRPVEGPPPTRARSGVDPLDRSRYLLAVTGRGDSSRTDR